MALIIEDGTEVLNASSYVTVLEATAYALARGVVLPPDEADCDVLLIKAMDWLESLRDSYQGLKVSATQPLQWPRSGVTIDSFDIDSDVIPQELKRAQMQVAMDLFSGLDPQANYNGQPLTIREKVDVIETQYANPSSDTGPVPYLRKAYSLLLPLFRTGAGASLSLTRV